MNFQVKTKDKRNQRRKADFLKITKSSLNFGNIFLNKLSFEVHVNSSE